MGTLTLIVYGLIGAGLGYILSILLSIITKKLFGDNILSKAINYSLLLLGIIIYVGSYSKNVHIADRSLAYMMKKINTGITLDGTTVNKFSESFDI